MINLISYIIAGIVAMALMFFFITPILMIVIGIIVLMVGCWALGFKIIVKVDDRKIGYIRWTKFYPLPKG